LSSNDVTPHAVHGLCCRKVTAVDKDGKQAEEALLLVREQAVAPGNGLAHGLLADGQISRPVRQHLQAMFQTL
jgi:hypothetical protein